MDGVFFGRGRELGQGDPEVDVLVAVGDHGDGLEGAGVVRSVDSAEQDGAFVFTQAVEPETIRAGGGDVVCHEELGEIGIYRPGDFVCGIADA